MSNRIKIARAALGLTQSDLARLAKTTQAQINRLESGSRKLSKEWAERLSSPLQLDPITLLFPDSEDSEQFKDVDSSKSQQYKKLQVKGIARNVWNNPREQSFIVDNNEMSLLNKTLYISPPQSIYAVQDTHLINIAKPADYLISMNVKREQDIQDRDVVIVERSRFKGEMVERTAWRARQTTQGIELWALNPEQQTEPPIELFNLRQNSDETIKVAAKVLWILRKP